jgi:hypothetical protein
MPFCKRYAKRLLGSLSLFIFTIAFLECALWFLSSRSKAVRALLSVRTADPMMSDPLLEWRLNPALPDIDNAGFRNASVAESPFLVVLGDSQTYGTGVSREEAWPQQLTALSGEPVYNMGVPAYGPVQELVLMSRAMKFRPRGVAEAFYAGNDLYDAYHMVYTKDQKAELRSDDTKIISAINKAEKDTPLDQTVERLYQTYIGNFASPVGSSHDLGPSTNPARRFLSEHSRLWGLFRAAKRAMTNQLWNEQLIEARKSGGLWIPFQKGRIRTILVPQYRFVALKMEDPRIREGFHISVEAIRRMSSIAQENGVRFTVVLIPTKERAFFEAFAGDSDGQLVTVKGLAAEEAMMSDELKSDLRLNGIPCIDVLPALRDSLRAGESPYPVTFDGHPNVHGHKIIAAAVWRAMTAPGD